MRCLNRGGSEKVECLIGAPESRIGALNHYVASSCTQSRGDGRSGTRRALDADDKDDLGHHIAYREAEKRPVVGDEIEVLLGLGPDIALVLDVLDTLNEVHAFRWTSDSLDHILILVGIV